MSTHRIDFLDTDIGYVHLTQPATLTVLRPDSRVERLPVLTQQVQRRSAAEVAAQASVRRAGRWLRFTAWVVDRGYWLSVPLSFGAVVAWSWWLQQ